MSDKQGKSEDSSVQTGEQEQDEGVTPEIAAVFGRQLKWQFQLTYLSELVVVQCVHGSHMKASARYEKGVRSTADSPAEQLA
jgi:hypothetical protein